MKPKKKEIITGTLDAMYTSEEEAEIRGYNQGLSAMETYYKGSELSEEDYIRIIREMDLLPQHDFEECDCAICEQQNPRIEKLAKAIISARAKKRGG